MRVENCYKIKSASLLDYNKDRLPSRQWATGVADVFSWNETLKMIALPDITINLWEIFARQRPQENGAI
jgi:hypothetical protein